jgi:predicted Zn-dependent peptidase
MQAAPKSSRQKTWQALLDVKEAQLSNGLRIRLLPSPNIPLVSLYTFFKVGSRNERPGITGISHLFEHMMFNGAKKYGPKMFDRILESCGGRSNAYTSTDVTAYYEDFAPESLPTVLDLESDRMRSLAISDRMLKSEREVVKEERRLRVDNEIMGMMDEELATLVYRAHPYRWPIIGWMGDIERISKEDCQAFFKTYYAPNNATIYVVGDIDVKKTLALIRKYYGSIRKGPSLPPVAESEPPPRGERRAVVRHPAEAPALAIGFLGPRSTHPDAIALDVAQYILSVGEGSRLTRELVYQQGLVVGVGMDWGWRMDVGMLAFFLELKPDSDPAKVEKALYEQLDRLAQTPPDDRELLKAKNNLKSHLLHELATNNGKAHMLGAHEMLSGTWRSILSLEEKYDAVSKEQVREVAATYFSPLRRSVVTLLPGELPAELHP